jgi:hypothetical protein
MLNKEALLKTSEKKQKKRKFKVAIFASAREQK